MRPISPKGPKLIASQSLTSPKQQVVVHDFLTQIYIALITTDLCGGMVKNGGLALRPLSFFVILCYLPNVVQDILNFALQLPITYWDRPAARSQIQHLEG